MLNHPYISMAVILPFTFIFVIGIFSILINIILPAMIAFWLAGWAYTAIVGRPLRQYYRRPFWYANYE
jgi:membrane protein implicated in regulation of membrane protease activity